jgi:hypothetical protein
MSRILRRPMFRGGSPNNGGIMSYAQPRKGYQGAGAVQPGYEDEDQDYGEDVQVRDRIDINSLPDMSGKKTGTGTGTDKKQLSYSDLLTQEYLGNRPDPMGKFLIQFGLNYMSATPKSGKFGALATAAESAKKPTEQLYSDIDTDRLLKLKLMTALGKGETKGSFEKKINFIWDSELKKPEGQRTFKVKEDVVDYIRKQESETKSQSVEDQVNNEAKKRIESNQAPNFKVAKNMAYFDLFGMDKIPKNESNALANRYYLPSNALTPKPNSTDFTLTDVKNLESTLGKLKEGQTYVEPTRRQVFLYVGNNAFRPLSKF